MGRTWGSFQNLLLVKPPGWQRKRLGRDGPIKRGSGSCLTSVSHSALFYLSHTLQKKAEPEVMLYIQAAVPAIWAAQGWLCTELSGIRGSKGYVIGTFLHIPSVSHHFQEAKYLLREL